MSTRLKDWAKTTTAPDTDDYLAVDGATNGSRRMLDSDYKTDVAADFVAAPTTYKLAPLNGSNKIDATYLPASGDTPLGDWLADNTAPVLSDGTGTAGDYYDVTNDNSGTVSQGAGTLAINGATVAVGDRIKYDGTNWFLIPQVSNLFDGTSTQAGAATAGNYYQTEDAAARSSGAIARPIILGDTASSISLTDLALLEPAADQDFAVSGEIEFPANPAAIMPIFQKRGAGAAGHIVRIDTGGRLSAYIQDSDSSTSSTADGDSLAGKKFRFLVNFDRDGNMTRYVNDSTGYGTADSISGENGSLASGAVAYVGYDGSSARFGGKIYSLQHWDGLATTEQIDEFMQTGEIPLSAKWATTATVVTDGGMENWTGSTLDNWTKGSLAGLGEETVDVQEGTSAADLTPGGDQSASNNNALRTPTNILEGDKSYRIEFKVKNKAAGTLQFGAGFRYFATWDGTTLTNGESELQNTYQFAKVARLTNTSLGSSWYQIEVDVLLNAPGSSADFRFAGSGQWLIDDVVITPIGVRWAMTGESYDPTNDVVPDLSSNGNNGTGTSITKDNEPRAIHIYAPTPAADEILFSVQGSNFGVAEDGKIRQENLGTDVPVAKYGADAITTAGTVSHQIPIDIGGTTYYLVAYTHGS